jgi:hypothetical protein
MLPIIQFILPMMLSALGKQVKKYKKKRAKMHKRHHHHQDKRHKGHNDDKNHKGEHVKRHRGKRAEKHGEAKVRVTGQRVRLTRNQYAMRKINDSLEPGLTVPYYLFDVATFGWLLDPRISS